MGDKRNIDLICMKMQNSRLFFFISAEFFPENLTVFYSPLMFQTPFPNNALPFLALNKDNDASLTKSFANARKWYYCTTEWSISALFSTTVTQTIFVRIDKPQNCLIFMSPSGIPSIDDREG